MFVLNETFIVVCVLKLYIFASYITNGSKRKLCILRQILLFEGNALMASWETTDCLNLFDILILREFLTTENFERVYLGAKLEPILSIEYIFFLIIRISITFASIRV